jgi:REP element-mobilizing transposase RayT
VCFSTLSLSAIGFQPMAPNKEQKMAFWRLYYHLVWGTKNRQPLITPVIETHLYSYLVHKASELGVFVYQINGWLDHVHLVVAIPPKLSIADVVKNLKGASSHFINDRQFLEEYLMCDFS